MNLVDILKEQELAWKNKERKIVDIEIDGIDTKDYPDFCDAYISGACYNDGTPLTEEELEELNEDRDLVYENVISYLY